MLSLGMFAARHFNRAMRKRGFMPGSAPPSLAAMLISLLSFEKIFPRLASIAPLKCLTFAHLLCPAIVQEFQFRSVQVGPQPRKPRIPINEHFCRVALKDAVSPGNRSWLRLNVNRRAVA